jgi:hypothetical protein
MVKVKTQKDFDLMVLDESLANQGLCADKYPDDEGYRWISTSNQSIITEAELQAAIDSLIA